MNNDKRKIGTCPGGRELGLRRCHVRGTGGHAPRLLEVPEGSQVPGPVPVGIAPAEMPQTCRMGRGREGLRAGGGVGGHRRFRAALPGRERRRSAARV